LWLLLDCFIVLLMYKPFHELSGQATIWIYQSSREMTGFEHHWILEALTHFATTWSSHGRPLEAGVEIRHGYFLILGVEKTDFELSCCTTDRLMYLLKEVKDVLGIDFLERGKLLVQTDDQRFLLSIGQAKERWQSGSLGKDSYVFDPTLSYKDELETRWRVPLAQFFSS
jgi:hypothetical protein